MKESDVHDRLRNGCKRQLALCLKFKCPTLAGAPDAVVLKFPARVWFIETKCPDGEVSKAQRFVHKMFAAAGFPVTLIWNYEEVDKFLERMKE